MIVQWIIDFIRDVVVNWLTGVPQPPAEFWTLRDWLVSSGAEINALASRFGIVVPWSAFGSMLAIWVSMLGFWGTIMVVRFALWAFGR